MTRRLTACLALTVLAALPAVARAQALGTYSWQLAPYCNVVTVTVTQAGAVYTLDGYDTQCGGAANRAPAIGMAVPNPNGTIGIGLTVVTSPGGTPVHVDAAISLGTLGGTWRDSLGQTGDFVFTPSGVASGGPRPAAGVVPDGAITTPKLADNAVTGAKILDGTVGAADIDAAEIQRRVHGACPSGQLMTAVSETGTVTCEAVTSSSGGDITAVVAGSGLAGGGPTGEVTLSADFSQVQARLRQSCPPNESIRVIDSAGNVECEPDNDSGDITAVIAGAGLTGGGTVGDVTLAVNYGGPGTASTSARSDHTHALGGFANTSVGEGALASGAYNTGMGWHALAGNTAGLSNTAVGLSAMEHNTIGDSNTAVGAHALLNNTTGDLNTSIGYLSLRTETTGVGNSALGAYALWNTADGDNNVGLGHRALTLSIGDDNVGVGAESLVNLVAGDRNVAIGRSAGVNLTAGSDNVYIRSSGVAGDTGTVRIGGPAQVRAFVAGVHGVAPGAGDVRAVVIDSNGQLGTAPVPAAPASDLARLESQVARLEHERQALEEGRARLEQRLDEALRAIEGLRADVARLRH